MTYGASPLASIPACPLCGESLTTNTHERDCPVALLQRWRLFTPSGYLTRHLLLLGAGNSDVSKKLRDVYQNHSGELLLEFQFFAETAANIFIAIRRAITDIQSNQRMIASIDGKQMPGQPRVPSSPSAEEKRTVRDAPTQVELQAQLFSDFLTTPVTAWEGKIAAAKALGLHAVAEYLKNKRPLTASQMVKISFPVSRQNASEALEIARQASHHQRNAKQQGG